MIPKRYITQWIEKAPWQNTAQIEQDLILSRVIAEIYNHSLLREHLVFRGGTALNKLFFEPGMRYSEDIDLVQYKEGPIGELMTVLHKIIDPWLGKPKYKQSNGRVTFYYRFDTENPPVKTMKVKVEINTREHGSELDLVGIPFVVENGWFSAQTTVTTYCLEELIATKLRALYQRRKGRDLFDIYHTLICYPKLDVSKILSCLKSYLKKEDLQVSRAEFEENMTYKLQDAVFRDDIVLLLAADLTYDQLNAYRLVYEKIISNLPGDPWRG
ncbi:MAG: nucleotidyl transferase AbiEii/AbiGii toxin family protein [Alphaproteobacteria bacterium]|nr:nucleotidyl transferase AbiEii/AbiGii toxin family protein [Alphaproteobacteria bacterium]